MRTSITILLVFQALLIIPAFGQNFAFHSNSPFGIQIMHEDSSRVANKVMFFDFDGDDDQDLFLSGVDNFGDFESWESMEYFIEMQENIGDKWNPQFADRIEPFANFPFPIGYFFPAIGDVNNDGDPDFVVFGDVNFFGGRTMLYLESDGGSSTGFNVVRGEFYGLGDFVPESFFIPELVDLDQDGDLDILMSGLDPAFAEEDGPDVPTYYYGRNRDIRSGSAVDFQGWYWNPYGLTPSPLSETLTSGDIDNDGDVDLLGSTMIIPVDSINRMYVHVNTPGITGKPIFDIVLESPFGLPTSFGEEQFLFPDLVDIDGDGDLDLFVFQITFQGNILQYYQNTMCELSMSEFAATFCDGETIVIEGVEYSEPGEYSIITHDPNGCASLTQLLLSEELTYSIDLHEAICEGDVYSIGSQDFSSSGHYEVLLFTHAGCDSLITLELNVLEIDNTVSIGGETITSNHAGASYQWIDCDTGENIPGAIGQSFEVLTTGNYSVSITDGSGCSSVSECLLVIVTAVTDVALSNAITLYPNPTVGLMNVINTSEFSVTGLTVTNLSGHVLGEFHPNETSAIDLSFLSQGIYFVKIRTKEFEIVKKLIVI